MTIAVMKTKAEQALTEAFEARFAKLPGSAAVKSARQAAIGRFGASGLPHRRVEEWKYTDLRNSLKEVFTPSLADNAASKITVGDLIAALGPLARIDAHRMTFVNGHCSASLCDLAGVDGIEVKALAGALEAAPEKVAAGLMAATGASQDATVALNTAFVTDGAVVGVAEGANVQKPLLIVFARAGQEPLAATVRNVISVGKNAFVTLIEAHVAVPGSTRESQVNALTQISVGEGATAVHVKVAADDGKAVHLSNWNVALGADATYRVFQYTTGQALARNQVSVIYQGEGGKLDLSGAYLGKGNEHIDTTLVVDHAVPHCESRELFKGVLDGQARGVFQGKIIVRPDAQKTDGKQMSQALMLSPDAEFDSKPELEIYADDVVCGHGTTSAELDPELLFYCKSRGIPEKIAKALLIESFIGEAIDRIENEPLRLALQAMATDWLHADGY